ncbi:MAG: signal peptidase I [Clostridia bacterium]|nr:signal peptidase I [Clostridia bacterium]
MTIQKNGDIKLLKAIIVYLAYIIIVPFIIYDVYLIAHKIMNPNSSPEIFGMKTFNIISGSMEPNISVDDIVITKKCDKLDIQLNDIITYRAEGETITHRVINIEFINNKVYYTTKGDSNEVADLKKVEYSQIEGKYVGRIPKIGKIFIFFKNSINFFITLTILFLCYLWQRKSIKKKILRKEKRIKFERKMSYTK